jgi:hypothetical protein
MSQKKKKKSSKEAKVWKKSKSSNVQVLKVNAQFKQSAGSCCLASYGKTQCPSASCKCSLNVE